MGKVMIKGVEYPIAVTFAAVAAYLEAVGDDDYDGLAHLAKIPPSRYPHLIAACVNEGLRKEGRDERLTAEMVRDTDIFEVGAAVNAIYDAMTPKTTPEKKS